MSGPLATKRVREVPVGPGARRTLAILVCAAVVALSPVPGVAQEADQVEAPTDAVAPPTEAMQPPTLEQAEISLAEAVRLTLRNDPRLQTEKQQVAEAMSVLQQARGGFDTVVSAVPAYTLEYREVFPSVRARERDKRLVFESLRDGAQLLLSEVTPLLADLTERDLDSLEDLESLRLPDCPPGFADLLFDPFDFNVNVESDVLGRTGLNPFDSFLNQSLRGSALGDDLGQLLQICDPSVPTATGVLGRLQRILELGSPEIQGSIDDAFNATEDILTLSRELGQLIAEKALLALERAGGIPKDEVGHTVSLQFSVDKPLRNGMDVGFDVTLRSEERNFQGKSFDPAFGGMGVPNSFPNSVSLRLDIPLGKGRGRVSRAAPERAAETIVAARQERLRHAISAEAFSTILAYIRAASAQERLALLEESAARQEEIVESTEELVGAGLVVGAERDRAAARSAAVRRSVAGARLEVLRARLVLADAMGVDVETLANAPLPAEWLPRDVDTVPDMEALMAAAPEQRRDVRFFEQSVAAAEIQAEAARADLKRNFDLSIRGGMSTLYESPFFKVFEDELDEPQDSSLRFYDPAGIWRSFEANWEPFVTANFTITFPVANNAAEGQLLQRRAQVSSSQIGLRNLERVIRENVVDVSRAIRHAREVLERRRQAVEWLEETLQGDLERFGLGDLTLIDTLQTEEDLTQERIALVRATERYLSLLARLKFETGQLVSFTGENSEAERVRFVTERLWELD